MSGEVVIVPTGTANTASVVAGLGRAGATASIAGDRTQVVTAERVVVPGVGSFGAAMTAIDTWGMRSALVERITDGRPTLAVCVGMQLLCAGSTENPGEPGLGIIDAVLTRFDETVRVPHLGWSRVEPDTGSRFLTPGWAYYANSYRLVDIPDGWTGATSDHGDTFVAGLERGDVLACQFHPELSAGWGSQLLSAWLNATGGGS